jgi:hypothetical protein
MVKMLIYIEDTAHERLRRISFDRRISMAAIVREAVEQWLRKQNRKGGTRR